MKAALVLTILMIFCSCCMVCAQTSGPINIGELTTTSPPNNTDSDINTDSDTNTYYILPDSFETEKKYPKYLLVIRYWGTKMEFHGGSYIASQGWNYLYETYDSLDGVLKRLQTYTGLNGMTSKQRKSDLVGLWDLKGEEGNIANEVLDLKETIREKEIKVEVEKWTERKWSIKEKSK